MSVQLCDFLCIASGAGLRIPSWTGLNGCSPVRADKTALCPRTAAIVHSVEDFEEIPFFMSFFMRVAEVI